MQGQEESHEQKDWNGVASLNAGTLTQNTTRHSPLWRPEARAPAFGEESESCRKGPKSNNRLTVAFNWGPAALSDSELDSEREFVVTGPRPRSRERTRIQTRFGPLQGFLIFAAFLSLATFFSLACAQLADGGARGTKQVCKRI